MPEINDQDQTDEAPGYALGMPFVTVTSKGGPHEDNAYCAGYEMGLLDARLSLIQGLATSAEYTIRAENRAQADLIAMRYGYTAIFDEAEVCADCGAEASEWLFVTFLKAEEHDVDTAGQ